MTVLKTFRNIRLDTTTMQRAAYPAAVKAAISLIRARHPGIKTFTYRTVDEAQTFYVGEGEEFSLVLGEERSQVDVVAEHNIGGEGLAFAIGHQFKAPVGAFVLRVSYSGRYFLDIYNVQPTQLTEGQ